MAAGGWVVELGDPADGQSLSAPSVTADQREAFLAARADCDSRVGEFPQPSSLTPAEVSIEYDRQIGIATCLSERGYPITEPPSRETFVSDYNRVDGVHWEAYIAVLDTGDREMYLDAADSCPRFAS